MSSLTEKMFRPPIDRTMRVLDRSFFKTRLSLAAARIFDPSQIHSTRQALTKENTMLNVDRLQSVRPSPIATDQALNRKAILLKPEIRSGEPSTWTSTLQKLADEQVISIVPYELTLEYDFWSYDEIMKSILPLDNQEEIPGGFSIAGHVGHLNLRPDYLPYKHIIAEIIVDKNPAVTTVINKLDEVGAHDPFRTFKYEVLTGDPSLVVETKESDCVFRFDWSKVYWNQRLQTEHDRILKMFRPGEAVCDACAGVGPFAIPAAKRKIFVWANDLNPACYQYLNENAERNNTQAFIRTFNVDGKQFIRDATRDIKESDYKVQLPFKGRRSAAKPGPRVGETIYMPKSFNHYVMNLPASATTFLASFRGLYADQETFFSSESGRQLPMIHVYCFAFKNNDQAFPQIREELSQQLGHKMEEGKNELSIHDVRVVAPSKSMYCASFRLPPEVAFRQE